MRNIEVCTYHPFRSASKYCCVCNCGLCKYCGYQNGQDIFCKDHEVKSTRGVYHFEANLLPQNIRGINNEANAVIMRLL